MRENSRSKKWWLIGLLAVVLINLFSLPSVLDREDLWRDTENHDTRTLLRETRKQNDFWRWFRHDWPLGNGFYRPIPTASFILDDKLYHNNLNMYRLTNWLIGVVCALLLAWFVWELFHSVGGALASAIIFSTWQSTLTDSIPFRDIGAYAAIPIALCGLLPGRGGVWRGILAAGVTIFFFRELSCWVEQMDIVRATFAFRNILWPPGRTATIMVLFLLPCFAGYCRYERERSVFWGILSIVCLIFAFFTYEQAIVAPAALFGCAIALHFQGIRVRWRWHIMPWLLALTYIALHRTFLPETRYTKQAYRGTTGGLRDLWAWLFPASAELKFMPSFFSQEVGLLFVLVDSFWLYCVQIAANAVAYYEARKEWLPVFFGLAGSVGTLLPMAFQHPLSHYYYLPMVFRSIMTAWLGLIAWRNLVSVFERRVLPKLEGPVLAPR